MDTPRDLILCDVRCFEGRQRGALRPITLLVGENSTGKTTFLAAYSVLHQMLPDPRTDPRLTIREPLDFNEQPFAMGSFRDIVRSRLGPEGRIEEFGIGFSIDPAPGRSVPAHTLLARFREEGAQPVTSSLRFDFAPDGFLELQRGPDGAVVRTPDHRVDTGEPVGDTLDLLNFLVALSPEERGFRDGVVEDLQPVIEYLDRLFSHSGRPNGRRSRRNGRSVRFWPPRLRPPVPIAPLRSKPKRTYDPVRATASPEGEHIPMLMMRLDRTEENRWDALHDALVAFGRGAGLFSDIKVKRHGKQMSDPFQLRVKVRKGPFANLMDVGYGVSQSLPILVDVLTAEESDRSGHRGRGRWFLLQQPEVHLHPRGQAELANFFIEAWKKRGHRFLIETHSDFVIDRVRIAVRKGRLQPDDVSILYFEPRGNAVTIHNMTLDEHGNLRGAPPTYRDFFTKETDELLGFAANVERLGAGCARGVGG